MGTSRDYGEEITALRNGTDQLFRQLRTEMHLYIPPEGKAATLGERGDTVTVAEAVAALLDHLGLRLRVVNPPERSAMPQRREVTVEPRNAQEKT